jgi:hypothetical protein
MSLEPRHRPKTSRNASSSMASAGQERRSFAASLLRAIGRSEDVQSCPYSRTLKASNRDVVSGAYST